MHPPALNVMDSIGPLIGAAVFTALMALVKEPFRLRLNGVLVLGASGVYLSGGLGPWELVYAFGVGLPLGSFALGSYRFVALAWFAHSTWDVVHHFWGNPIWPFAPTSSWGCMLFDSAFALGLLALHVTSSRRLAR